MIHFEKKILDNGLRILVHHDNSSPMASFNLLYDVGSRDEDPQKTGFAHLFEHLMFSGSDNITSFDEPIQSAGGENNAFTNSDITNYYITLPYNNIEIAFWLESDRMLSLAFSEKGLEVQRNVVIEEFKQNYLNQPYGDTHLLMRDLVYKVHPYRWATIGKEISHIENATMDEVKSFFFKHYAPNNAVLSIAGNVNPDEMFKLAEKWFGDIPRRDVPIRQLPIEPPQTQERVLHVDRDVPVDAIYLAFQSVERKDPLFYAQDIITDILSSGKSSRLTQKLVYGKKIFTQVSAYISGTNDRGYIAASGKPVSGIDLETARQHLEQELQLMMNEKVSDYELEKVKNRMESALIMEQMSDLNKAMIIGFYELMGEGFSLQSEIEKFRNVTADDIQKAARQFFRKENTSVIYYHSRKPQTSA